jgi:hypothetical protein
MAPRRASLLQVNCHVERYSVMESCVARHAAIRHSLHDGKMTYKPCLETNMRHRKLPLAEQWSESLKSSRKWWTSREGSGPRPQVTRCGFLSCETCFRSPTSCFPNNLCASLRHMIRVNYEDFRLGSSSRWIILDHFRVLSSYHSNL